MTINTSGSLYGTTVNSNLTLTVASRTSTGVKFNYSITSYLNASGFVSGETYSGKITISGTSITTKVTNLTIKPYADYWSGTTQHTITGTIDVVTSSYADLTASVLYEVTTSASADKNSGTGTIKTGSGQPPLTPSSVSASASVTAGNNISVTVTPASNFYSVKHTVSIYIGNNKIAETNIAASTTAKTVSINIPTSAANYIKTSMSGTAKVQCITYSGTISVGLKSVNTTINVPAYTLTGSISATPVASTRFSNKNLQNVTKLDVAVSGVSNYGATLSYKSTIDNVTYNTATFTTSAIKQSGSVTVSATITDSRGKTRTVTSSAVTFVAYTAPTITSLSAGRNATTPSNVDITVRGTYYPLSGSNTLTSHTSLAGNTDTRTTTTASYTLTFTMTANELQTYNGTIYVSDSVGKKSATYAFTISTKAVQLDFHNSGKGMAMGKVAEYTDKFDCAYPMMLQGEDVADWILEQGTSGIWTYEKWHSGKAICWARTQVHTSAWATYGNVYQSISESVSFPSNFFTAKPNLLSAPQGNLASFNYRYTQSTKDAFSVGIVSGYQYASNTPLDIFVFAIGRWE